MHRLFNIFITIVLTTAAVVRIIFPEIRQLEIESIPLNNPFMEWLIILFELASGYFLLAAPKMPRQIYLSVTIIGITLISLYYVYTGPSFSDYKYTCVYLNDPKAVVLHATYLAILLWMIYSG